MTAPATTASDSTSTPPPGTSSDAPRTPEPYRFPADHPEVWARGKTAEEVLAVTRQLDQTVQQLIQTPRQPQQPQPVAQATANPFDLPDDDYIQGRQVKQILQQLQSRGPDPYAQRALEAATATAMGFVQQKPENRDVFDRYGPEIRALVAQMPPETRTLDNLQVAVDLVQGRHWRDLVASEAQRFAAENPTMRSTGGAGAGSIPSTQPNSGVLENPAIPAEARARLKEQGLTDHQIWEFCNANGMTPDQFVKMYAAPRNTVIDFDRPTQKLPTGEKRVI